jgi:enoyl-CoA hydratase
MSDHLAVARQADGVALLTLNRPDRLNALSSEVGTALADAVADLGRDDAIGAIIVAGAGRAFCAGADIEELDGLDGPLAFRSFIEHLTACLDVLERCPKPSVAAIHGVAMGGGLELALACDLRVAEETARLGVPEIKLGLLPGAAGTARLPRLLPPTIARQMLLTGDPISAATAERFGLLNVVVPAGEALNAAQELATKLAAGPPLARAAAKRLLNHGAQMPLEVAIALERETVSMLFGTQDRAEGIKAFLNKRVPEFKGR